MPDRLGKEVTAQVRAGKCSRCHVLLADAMVAADLDPRTGEADVTFTCFTCGFCAKGKIWIKPDAYLPSERRNAPITPDEILALHDALQDDSWWVKLR